MFGRKKEKQVKIKEEKKREKTQNERDAGKRRSRSPESGGGAGSSLSDSGSSAGVQPAYPYSAPPSTYSAPPSTYSAPPSTYSAPPSSICGYAPPNMQLPQNGFMQAQGFINPAAGPYPPMAFQAQGMPFYNQGFNGQMMSNPALAYANGFAAGSQGLVPQPAVNGSALQASQAQHALNSSGSEEEREHKYSASKLKLLEADKKDKKRERSAERKQDKSKDRKRDKSSDKHSDKGKDKRDKSKERKRELSSDRKGTRDKSADRKRGEREKSPTKRDKSSDRRHDASSDRKKADKKADKKAANKEDKKTDKKADKKSDTKSDKKEKKKDDKSKEKDKKSDSKSEKKNGILKGGKEVEQAGGMQAGSVKFAGPDNRVHQSVVNVSQFPGQGMVHYQDPTQQGYMPHMQANQVYSNGYTPVVSVASNMPMTSQSYPLINGNIQGTSSLAAQANATYMMNQQAYPVQQQQQQAQQQPQQQTGSRLVGSALINTNIPTATHIHQNTLHAQTYSDYSAVTSDMHRLNVNKHEQGQRHVTSIDIDENAGVPSNRPPVATARGGLPQYRGPNQVGSGHKHGFKQPFVLGEVNITENQVHSGHNKMDAYKRFDTLVQKARNDDITYAEILFDRQNRPVNANTLLALQKDRVANCKIEMDSDEENEHPMRIKGILKPPKRVEFNKDVDMTLYNTLSSRHESFESLYPQPQAYYQQRPAPAAFPTAMYPMYGMPAPPAYTEVMDDARPLDDMDLFMYTMRRRRQPLIPRAVVDGTLRSARRSGSLRARCHAPPRSMRVPPTALRHALW